MYITVIYTTSQFLRFEGYVDRLSLIRTGLDRTIEGIAAFIEHDFPLTVRLLRNRAISRQQEYTG
jgi:hypothetical protein